MKSSNVMETNISFVVLIYLFLYLNYESNIVTR
jgi:hypothetical protein